LALECAAAAIGCFGDRACVDSKSRRTSQDHAPMMDFEVDRCTRRCAVTGRDFEPGESIYSALIVDAGRVVRLDYSADAWTGPPEASLGWWKSQSPTRDAKKSHWAPNDVLLELLDAEAAPAADDFRYVLSLLLARRRVLRLEQTEKLPDGRDVTVFYCPRNEKTYKIVTEHPSDQRAREIQQQLSQLLVPGN
jgi:hypothetical protein